jgi:hypothetical protein
MFFQNHLVQTIYHSAMRCGMHVLNLITNLNSKKEPVKIIWLKSGKQAYGFVKGLIVNLFMRWISK